jgi:hypothetical protein
MISDELHCSESGGERYLRDGQICAGEKRARCLRAVRAGEGEWPGPKFGNKYAREVACTAAESVREPGDSLALNDAIEDEAHRPRGEIVAKIPVGNTGHSDHQTTLARAQACLVCSGGDGEKLHIMRLWGGDGRATRAAVDAGGVHAHNELPVKPCILRGKRSVTAVVVEDGHGLILAGRIVRISGDQTAPFCHRAFGARGYSCPHARASPHT